VLCPPSVATLEGCTPIQGHTDERGTVQHNRDLSAKRANTVLDYMFEVESELADRYGSYFAASAFSEFRPLRTEKTEAAFQQNRRIEISVLLKTRAQERS
jgi:chemotaxis protein MotB